MKMPKKLRFPASLTILAIITITGPASWGAEGKGGVNPLPMVPTIDSVGPSESTTLPQPGSFAVGMVYDYAERPLTADQTRSGDSIDIVGAVHRSVALATLGVNRAVSLQLTVPYIFAADGTPTEGSVNESGNPGSGSLGDILIQAKIKVLRLSRYEVVMIPSTSQPTGSPDHLSGDGVAAYSALVSLSYRVSRWKWALSGGYTHRDSDAVLEDERLLAPLRVGSQFRGAIGGGFQASSLLGLEAGVQAATPANRSVDYDVGRFAEMSIKATARVSSALRLEGQIATGVGYGIGVSSGRASVGFIWVPTRTGSMAVSTKTKSVSPSKAKAWYEARAQDFANGRDIRENELKTKSYDREGEKSRSFGFYTGP